MQLSYTREAGEKDPEVSAVKPGLGEGFVLPLDMGGPRGIHFTLKEKNQQWFWKEIQLLQLEEQFENHEAS